MKLAVSLENEGGPLETRFAYSEKGAKETAIMLIRDTAFLQNGDKITIKEVSDDTF